MTRYEFHPIPHAMPYEVETPEYSFHDVHEPIKGLIFEYEEEVLSGR